MAPDFADGYLNGEIATDLASHAAVGLTALRVFLNTMAYDADPAKFLQTVRAESWPTMPDGAEPWPTIPDGALPWPTMPDGVLVPDGCVQSPGQLCLNVQSPGQLCLMVQSPGQLCLMVFSFTRSPFHKRTHTIPYGKTSASECPPISILCCCRIDT
jgi:hypothetical protein